jgi:hypothetical protein
MDIVQGRLVGGLLFMSDDGSLLKLALATNFIPKTQVVEFETKRNKMQQNATRCNKMQLSTI